ncbi:hypothetical protein JKP88DRAFT_228811 [Tribonema minus]|uniref:Uncharacterized protein n=1 Tax=Tribonema minus TaxID=303371 RepID=A0A835YHU4_9STRA|nr:hypothetical protein JKP88DRAFT_228811 [Tribonema minus]
MLARRAAYAASTAFRRSATCQWRTLSSYSGDNVTYSGGQEGTQGGFYGSGGARSKAAPNLHHRPEAVASQEDIERLKAVMEDVMGMESELAKANSLNARTIEIKGNLKKTLSSPAMMELLNRLEIQSEPVWGLTQKERDLVRSARRKVNTC